jgi:hypothetical protein
MAAAVGMAEARYKAFIRHSRLSPPDVGTAFFYESEHVPVKCALGYLSTPLSALVDEVRQSFKMAE